MNSAEARRHAKQAARLLLEARGELVGELAVQHAAVLSAHAALAKAQEAVADAELIYRQARADTVAAGWSSEDLTSVGCPPSRLRLRQSDPSLDGAATPADHAADATAHSGNPDSEQQH